MEKLKKPLSIKVIYWITNITFWLYAVVAVLITALATALMFDLFSGDLQFDTIEIISDVQTFPAILLGALFIWVLSHIFMKGCELQDETNFTV